ncbi:hypothetical protein K443DRAFT_664331 [Laccaria amethystina LaAM-08-1]|uniref:Uncharacterized protein n=1 Tax=Laccaria amethystina LaAM-08-1 TaxID=1095629 RepID=A0A0C9WQS6_9AGAR|nr:hypothetical protein K443DRAFT_664331 [Laccaria amethystina LaAM-08-1]
MKPTRLMMIVFFRNNNPDQVAATLYGKKIIQELSKGASNAHADDSSSLKAKIISYLLVNTQASNALTLNHIGAKLDRGIFMDFKAGLKPVTATLLPRFLYPDGQEYNEDDTVSGILRGHLMIRVAKHIFQGPSAALKAAGYHRGKQGIASLIHIISMDPHLIAYIAVQARFSISSSQQWSQLDGSFDYGKFYWNIVGLFDDGEGQEIIDFYNHHIFGRPLGASAMAGTASTPPVESDFDRLKVQQATRHAQVAAATGEADA